MYVYRPIHIQTYNYYKTVVISKLATKNSVRLWPSTESVDRWSKLLPAGKPSRCSDSRRWTRDGTLRRSLIFWPLAMSWLCCAWRWTPLAETIWQPPTTLFVNWKQSSSHARSDQLFWIWIQETRNFSWMEEIGKAMRDVFFWGESYGWQAIAEWREEREEQNIQIKAKSIPDSIRLSFARCRW